MEADRLAAMLHPLERKVLPLIAGHPSLSALILASGLKDVEVMRALQWLQNKKLIILEEKLVQHATLGKLGLDYMEKGLPERRFMQALEKGPKSLATIKQVASLENDELNVCIGLLKKKVAIDTAKEEGHLILSLTDQGRKLLQKESLEESFLKKKFPLDPASLQPEEKFALESLKKRSIVELKETKERTATLTKLGKDTASKTKDTKVTERLTSGMLKTGSWKKQPFRPYDIGINVPQINFGRRHFVKEALQYVRKVWLELGFEETSGSIIQPGFWNFDALFTAQDHPVRDMQDTFYLKDITSLPDKELVSRVKQTHENGWTTGSKGWRTKWEEKEARRQVLRTHTTCLSAQSLAKMRMADLPKKIFSVGLSFRNETMDWSHLFEFHQSEGIVVDENANFKHLIGYLTAFFRKMGFPKIRARPGYFPYTEPSVEVDVYDDRRKRWIELGGAGIFRPELVKPLLGKDIPVLAWGLGLSRIIMPYYGITDIRDLNRNDLKQLREVKAWLR
ncbi:MAG: phenylalanine--tRNA ligase subunit alpha [Nanoarchaeota archaeon]|nr:phenylalanine--tRNA ligase subunit alpha [Nanoarchaeota archaeon]